MNHRIGADDFLDDAANKGAGWGVLTNPSANLLDGTPVWAAMLENNMKIRALFAPEHGFKGNVQDAVPIDSEITADDIHVHSIFGKNLEPTAQMLRGLDAVVFDIQDIGCRYYTYVYSLGYMMKACEKYNLPLVVLDRPNPLGTSIEGNIIDEDVASFVGGYGLTNSHGMTIGELACYIRKYYYPKLQLKVYWMSTESAVLDEWEGDYFWSNPSPNMPRIEAVRLYPGTCLFEGTNVSEGRGTTMPFQLFGAPWMEAELLRNNLSELDPEGVSFSAVHFKPCFSKYTNQPCQGVIVNLHDTSRCDSFNIGIKIIYRIKEIYPTRLRWKTDWDDGDLSFFDRLSGNTAIRELIDKGAPISEVITAANEGRDDFMRKTSDCLHYRRSE